MKFLATSCVVLFCLAHSSDCDRRKHSPDDLVYLTKDDDGVCASFVGGGTMQDSCRGEVKFKSQLNHTDLYSLDWISYKVTTADGKTKVFSGWWFWKATPKFMDEYRAAEGIDITDPDGGGDYGYSGDELGWQEECEERSTHISQCDRMFGHNMYYPDRLKPNNGILTGRGDPLNPAYYEITFNSTTEDGCTRQWTDRLVFQFHSLS